MVWIGSFYAYKSYVRVCKGACMWGARCTCVCRRCANVWCLSWRVPVWARWWCSVWQPLLSDSRRRTLPRWFSISRLVEPSPQRQWIQRGFGAHLSTSTCACRCARSSSPWSAWWSTSVFSPGWRVERSQCRLAIHHHRGCSHVYWWYASVLWVCVWLLCVSISLCACVRICFC